MELYEQIKALCKGAAEAAPSLASASTKQKNAALTAIAELLEKEKEAILKANTLDLECAEENGVPPQMLDRLALNDSRIDGIADALRELVNLTDPIGSGECWTRPSGITIRCVRVPLGVIGIIFEARPNVTVDAAALCLKTGNATVLRGGKEAINTNIALVELMKKALAETGIDSRAISLITDTSHEGANILMEMTDYVDVLIPRGSHRLIKAVKERSKVPVIETGAGNCHVYVDKAADLDIALRVAVNAKCQRPSVCNAAETLLLHRSVAAAFLPLFYAATRTWQLELRGDADTCRILPEATPATEEDFATEYNDYIMTVKVLDSVEEAVAHINTYGTKHSECIITQDQSTARLFMGMVDAAAVYHNASTRFTDGGEFGLGAEIGISTQKLHARGPMGLEALTTVKYLVSGDGTVRT